MSRTMRATGNILAGTFAGFFSDEPCLATMTPRMRCRPLEIVIMPILARRTFAALNEELGELALPLLPALWFDLGPRLTAKFRLAYMNVITRLYQRNFF